MGFGFLSIWKCLPAFLSLALPLAAFASSGPIELQSRISSIFSENRDAVVRIRAIFNEPTPGEEEFEDETRVSVRGGTGFFISRQGHILADANHVLHADRIVAVKDEIAYVAELMGHDDATDLALLRVVQQPKDFAFVHLPDVTGPPPVATLAVMISAPLEFGPSPALGLVSGFESSFLTRDFPTTYIRTTIPAGLGEGGSPVFDLKGNFIGLVRSSLRDISGSYLIPARAVRRVRDDLVFAGKVTYGWFGFEVEQVGTVEAGLTVRVKAVEPESPAEQAGLQPADVLVRMGSFPIEVTTDVRDAVFYARAGQLYPVIVEREGVQQELMVPVAVRPDPQVPPAAAETDEPVDAIEPGADTAANAGEAGS